MGNRAPGVAVPFGVGGIFLRRSEEAEEFRVVILTAVLLSLIVMVSRESE